MKALDLFCGAGGASMGLAMAGYEVTGVDLVAQPSYPFRLVVADALTYPLEGYDLIWASPPCQAYTWATGNATERARFPDLVAPIRLRLRGLCVPWVIENVPTAPLRNDLTLCGGMFGLPIIRHRRFELSAPVAAPPHRPHTYPFLTVTGHMAGVPRFQQALGITWCHDRASLAQCVPPAYSAYIARQLLAED